MRTIQETSKTVTQKWGIRLKHRAHSQWGGQGLKGDLTSSRPKGSRLPTGLWLQESLENLDLRTPRGLDRAMIHKLAGGQWIRQHLNILVNGPTGPVS